MSPKKKIQKHCLFCVNKQIEVDYKNVQLLRRFISSFGKIVPRKRSGICDGHQRILSTQVKRARIIALLPFVAK